MPKSVPKLQSIRLRGVRQNNLKNIDVDIPLGKYVAVTGLSGAGKSSLVFETLHAEGQRRYVETFSSYTRQFLDLLEKPDLDSAENARPSIAIEQKNTIKTSRSTVGTMTELTDFFKVWFSHVASLYDPQTGEEIQDDNPRTIWTKAKEAWNGNTVIVAFEVKRPEKLTWKEIFKNVKAQGYSRFIDSENTVHRVDDSAATARIAEIGVDCVFVIQDRIQLKDENFQRFLEAAETALEFGQGELCLFSKDCKLMDRFSRGLHSPKSGRRFRPAIPALFSFNSPVGACAKCRGFGRVIEIDYRLAIPDRNLSIEEGLIRPFEGKVYGESKADLERACKRLKIPTKKPFNKLSQRHQDIIINGECTYRNRKADEDWDGIVWYGVKGFFDWLEKNTYKMHVRIFLSRYRAYVKCPNCEGTRLQPDALCWKWNGFRLPDLYQTPISDLQNFINGKSAKVSDSNSDAVVNRQSDLALEAIKSRLHYLNHVGLGYLTLDRPARTLSGGEVERVTLTSCLGTSLVDTLFVLDEPSVGLHPRDIDRLINIIRNLVNGGNTVVVVEHDDAIITAADHVLEIGPEPGPKGGQIVFQGNVKELASSDSSITGSYLSGRQSIESPSDLRPVNFGKTSKKQPSIRIRGASKHNIQDLDIDIPLARFVCISGVSGSGKSTLLNNVLYQPLLSERGRLAVDPAAIESIDCDSEPDEIVLVDQTPISRTPRSNPAVFVDAWDEVRKLFGKLPEAEAQGYTASSFSFNAGDGRCEHCKGLGYEKVEMQFLSDVYVPCPHCNGRRFKAELLEIRFLNHSIADLLDLTIEQAMQLFQEYPRIYDKLTALSQIGLGYLKLGQPLNTLSGGESQRLKLVKYLRVNNSIKRGSSKSSNPDSGSSLILLDEPTTGLHKHDVKCLLAALQQLVDHGHSLIVIEHNLDVLKSADWIIELGPEAGSNGGRLVFQGPPTSCAASAMTETGKYLARELDANQVLLAAESQGSYETNQANGNCERELHILGAREHNLKNIEVSIPHYSLSVVTGVSGSGKSTLAFDIAFGEGQRRFMESMSPYARQFVEQLPRPDLDQLNGIQPTIAIEQRVTRGSRKSTVATITEVAQYLRLLYSRLGVPHNPNTGEAMLSQTTVQLEKRLHSILRQPAARKSQQLLICSPVIRNRKGHHQPIANWIANHGYEMMRVDGEIILTEDFEKLDRYREHNIEIVIADLDSLRGSKAKIKSVLQEALKRGKGTALLLDDREEIVSWLSTHRMDPRTGQALPELDPKDFSFNSSKGWCPTCRGHGRIYPWMREQFDENELLEKSIGADAGDDDESDEIVICPDCQGERLNRTSRNVFLPLKANRWISLPQLLSLTPRVLLETLNRLKLDARGKLIARDIVDQIRERLQFMDSVGLEYLSLDRATQTLSGGEAQRIRLAAQLGSNLAGVLYILDEPSIGLHARDGDRLIGTLKSLRSKGNTLLVVEHDEAMMENADRIIDLGPGAGTQGGELIAEGTLEQLKGNRSSLTGKYLKKGIPHPIRGEYRKPPPRAANQDLWVKLSGVNFRNLKNQSIRFPMERLIMVCGSSGAGKSSLIRDLLGNAACYAIKAKKNNLSGKLFANKGKPIEGEEGSILFDQLTGGHRFRSVLEVDQSPIGKTPRSTPATYLGVFDIIRQFFASLPEAKMRGYKPGRFSFNTPHGRCPTCSGAGRVKLEMSFMPDTYMVCEDCNGLRYGQELLELHWRGKNIADTLNMTFDEAAEFFSFHTRLQETMQLMVETGLGYLTLGQSSPTLSGGEAQRMKLATELARGLQTFTDRRRGIQRKNLYILEEPTIGLHLSDCEKLIRLLHRLVDQGHTVIVIEHHLDLIAEADYLIEVGPGGGPKGGKILYQGNLNGLNRSKRSVTLEYLQPKIG